MDSYSLGEQIIDPADPQYRGGWIYYLWNADDVCIYVGQTTQPNPWMRLAGHRGKRWWHEVRKVSYAKADVSRLDKIEGDEIRKLSPAHNAFAPGAPDRERVKLGAPASRPKRKRAGLSRG